MAYEKMPGHSLETTIGMTQVSVIPAEDDDAAALMVIATSAFSRSLERYGYFPHGMDSVEWHREHIDRGCCHVIKYDDRLVGGIYLDPHPEDSMKIEYFFISPASQNQGIGSEVMRLVEQMYDTVAKWFLLTPHEDYENHHFYEKLGYAKARKLKPDSGEEFAFFEYEKVM